MAMIILGNPDQRGIKTNEYAFLNDSGGPTISKNQHIKIYNGHMNLQSPNLSSPSNSCLGS